MSEAKKVDTFRKDFSNKSKQRLKFSDQDSGSGQFKLLSMNSVFSQRDPEEFNLAAWWYHNLIFAFVFIQRHKFS